MRYLVISEVFEIHFRVMQQSGGLMGVRDLGALESALAQPRMTFGGAELYPTLAEKAAALGFALVKNHPFVDGNKRTGHAAMEICLVLNGHQINARVDEQFDIIMALAGGTLTRDEFVAWLKGHVQKIPA